MGGRRCEKRTTGFFVWRWAWWWEWFVGSTAANVPSCFLFSYMETWISNNWKSCNLLPCHALKSPAVDVLLLQLMMIWKGATPIQQWQFNKFSTQWMPFSLGLNWGSRRITLNGLFVCVASIRSSILVAASAHLGCCHCWIYCFWCHDLWSKF